VRLPRTLWLSLWREVAGAAALGLGAVALLYLGRNLLRYLGRLHALGAGPADVAQVAGCVLVVMAAHALPAAFVFGVAVALSRVAADGEALALRACGVGLGALAAPVLVLALAVSAATALASLELEPRARRGLREAFHAMAARGALFEPGSVRELAGRTLFVRGRGADGALEGVFLEDRTHPERPFVLFAEAGSWRWDAERARLHLHLERGDVVFERAEADRADRDPARLHFATLDYAFDAGELSRAGPGELLPKDMSLGELRDVVAHARAGGSLAHLEKRELEHYEMQIQRRFALPAAPLVLALAGVPLALRPGRAARARGAWLCGILVGGYYAAFVAARAVALAGGIPPAAAPWLPNAAFALAGIALCWRARRMPT
jgi:lipopolysaccharide export LptBFGC system permease protein LptF